MSAAAEPVKIGQRFGHLTILREVERIRTKHCVRRMVQVECDCGNIRTMQLHNIMNAQAYSCGCMRHQLRKFNPYSDKNIKEAHEFLMTEERLDKLELIRSLEYVACYGNLTAYQFDTTMTRINQLTREVLC